MKKVLSLLPPQIATKAIELYKTHKDLCTFVLRMAFLILLWKTVFFFIWRNDFLLSAYNEMSLHVIGFILHCCAFLMTLFQYNVEIDALGRILRIIDTIGVTVGEPCIGYEVTALFTALIIAHKGQLLKKIWFIPLGVLLIYALNIIRICALAISVQYNQVIWELNHKLIFTLFIYGVIFLLWRWWLRGT